MDFEPQTTGRSYRSLLLIILFMILFFSPLKPAPIATEVIRKQTRDLEEQLKALNASKTSDDLLPPKLDEERVSLFQRKSRDLVKRNVYAITEEKQSIWRNSSGIFLAEWEFTNHRRTGKSKDVPKLFKNDVDGLVRLSFNDRLSFDKDISWSRIEATFTNRKRENPFTIFMTGIHHMETGTLLISSSLSDFKGKINLLGFLVEDKWFQKDKEQLTRIIKDQLDRLMVERLPSSFLEESLYEPKCAIICNLAIDPVKDWSLDDLKEYENELRIPTGAILTKRPVLSASGFMYSPNCDLQIQFRESKGTPEPILYKDLQDFAILQIMFVTIQVFLTLKQMTESSTPTAIMGFSIWPIMIQAFFDGLVSFTYFNIAVYYDQIFLTFMSLAFLLFVSVALFSQRFMLLITRIQRSQYFHNQNATTQRDGEQQTNQQQNDIVNHEIESENSIILSLYGRFYLSLILAMFVLSQLFNFIVIVQRIIIYSVVIISSAFWIPQILRNILRGSKKVFSWYYLLGITMTRGFTIYYIFTEFEEFWPFEPNIKVAYAAIGILSFPMLIILYQDIFGPRYLIPEKFLPAIYNYHRPLSIEDLESSGHDINRSLVCAVCLNEIQGLSKAFHSNTPGISLARRSYMITPCNHIFHTQCLESWMKVKLACPVCRTSLPPA